MGLRLCDGNAAELFFPDDLRDEKKIYVFDELRRVFGVQKYEDANVVKASARELKLVAMRSQKGTAPNSS
mgnify:FL=1